MKTCQEITELIEKTKVTRTSVSEKLAIRTHVAICGHCRTYFKDSKILDRILVKRFRHLGDYKFTEEEKEEMKRKVG